MIARRLIVAIAIAAGVLGAFGARAEPAEQRSAFVAELPTTVQSASASPASSAEAFGLPVDKVLHGAISANLALGATAFARAAGLSSGAAVVIGAAVAIAIGLAKEAVDLLATPAALRSARLLDSVGDLAFDVLGTGASAVCVLLALRGTF